MFILSDGIDGMGGMGFCVGMSSNVNGMAEGNGSFGCNEGNEISEIFSVGGIGGISEIFSVGGMGGISTSHNSRRVKSVKS